MKPNQCLMVGRIALSSSRTKGNGSRRFFEALLFMTLKIQEGNPAASSFIPSTLPNDESCHFVNHARRHFFLGQVTAVFKGYEF